MMQRLRSHVALLALLLCAGAIYVQPAHAQVTPAQAPAMQAPAAQPQAAIVPQDITVGAIFRAAVRLEVPAGVQLAAPDSLLLPEDLENAGPREIRFDTATAADGRRRVTLVYPLSAWRPGSYELPPVTLRLVGDGRDAELNVQFPSFDVQSVLPADTAGIEPRPARDVLGANRLWWPILLALLLAAIVAGALYYWWKRRRRQPQEEPIPMVVPVLPRAAALASLEELRRSGLIERGEHKEYYARLTGTLRRYAYSVNRQWSTDLTTGELAPRLLRGGAPNAEDLLRILGGADLVKFARARADSAAAWRDLDAAVAWIERAEPAAESTGSEDRRVA